MTETATIQRTLTKNQKYNAHRTLPGCVTKSGPGKQPQAPTARHCGLECPPTALPTCCLSQYPPGSTVLECLLEGDQPVAHVLQVPAEPASTAQKTCLLVETKQSPSGPFSRVVALPQDPKGCVPNGYERNCTKNSIPTFYALESYDCPGGANARAALVPVQETEQCPDVLTTIETSQQEEKLCGPHSRIVQGVSNDGALKPNCCNDAHRESPVTFIECMSTASGPAARVTHYPRNQGTNPCARRIKGYYETSVPMDGCRPKATGFQCPVNEDTLDPECIRDVVETRVSQCGPQASMQTFPGECCTPKYCGYLDSRLPEGPYARINQRITACAEDACVEDRKESALDCCPPADKVLLPRSRHFDRNCHSAEVNANSTKSERRNGLDQEDEGHSFGLKAFKHGCRACPANQPPAACPMRQSEKCTSREANRSQGRHEAPKKACVPESSSNDRRNRTGEKSNGSRRRRSPCENSHAEGKAQVKSEGKNSHPRCDSAKFNGAPAFSISRFPSQELITRYKDYIPINQLLEYEANRSKRNGLQDEYVLPVPRAVLEMRKQEAEAFQGNDECADKSARDDDDELKITVRLNRETTRLQIPVDCEAGQPDSRNPNFARESRRPICA